MNKKHFSVICVIVVVLAALLFLWRARRSGSNAYSNATTISTSTTQPFVVPSSTTTASSTPPQAPIVYEYDVSLPDALMLVDSQGRRTGKNPLTGVLYHEIPGTAYSEMGNSGQLFFTQPPNGQYALYVLGEKTGAYWIDAGNVNQQAQVFQGTIQAGSMVAYTEDYDSTNLANSNFSFEGTASSTASITSAPPNNLPPPPVP